MPQEQSLMVYHACWLRHLINTIYVHIMFSVGKVKLDKVMLDTPDTIVR